MPPFIIIKKLMQRARSKYAKEKAAGRSDLTRTSTVNKHPTYFVKIENLEMMKNESLESVCRICLKEGHNPIYKNGSSESVAEMIQEHASVEISQYDTFPKCICDPCLALLQAAVQFRTTARASDQKLRFIVSRTIGSEKKNQSETDCLNILNDPMDDEITSQSGSDTSVPHTEAKKESNGFISCKKCNLHFKSQVDYSEHLRSDEHRSGRVPCGECGAMVKSFYLSTHILRRHRQERPYVCEVCGKSFAVLGALRTHAGTVHVTALRFACTECPYRGRFAESLRVHRRVHTGEKPFACSACPARFRTKSNLNKHARTHLTKFAYKCGQCNKGFHRMRDMNEHEKVQHSGIKEHRCSICGKEFGYRKGLMQHLREVHHMAKRRSGRMPLYLLQEKSRQDNVSQDSRGPDDT